MKNLILPSQTLAAARLCQAKNDVRYYLNGVYINHNTIVSTNGHVMFVGPYRNEDGKRQWLPPSQDWGHADELQEGQDFILDIRGVIPVKAKTSELIFTEAYPFEEVQKRKKLAENAKGGSGSFTISKPLNTLRTGVILHRDVHGLTIGSGFFSTIDGKFPRWEKIIDDTDDQNKTTKNGFAQIKYFGLASKVIGKISQEYGACDGADVELFDNRLRFKYTSMDRITYQMIVMGMNK
jgi:hypothetical protein